MLADISFYSRKLIIVVNSVILNGLKRIGRGGRQAGCNRVVEAKQQMHR